MFLRYLCLLARAGGMWLETISPGERFLTYRKMVFTVSWVGNRTVISLLSGLWEISSQVISLIILEGMLILLRKKLRKTLSMRVLGGTCSVGEVFITWNGVK